MEKSLISGKIFHVLTLFAGHETKVNTNEGMHRAEHKRYEHERCEAR
jgi:hypothetical protein